MGWFKFNNISSDTMGVILTETPPITRAPKRYNSVYIDGLDGCEVDDLGYSAYIKKFKIGITEGADIDQVMDWLTGSGQLIIWNESDKYYDVQILDQIDYDRLISFHTATVSFLCQPYKYAISETTTTETNITLSCNCDQLPSIKVTGSGEITLKVNNTEICSVTLSTTVPWIVMDSTKQDAFYNGSLANRSMRGNFIKLKNGDNVITCTGMVTEIKTTYRKRWL